MGVFVRTWFKVGALTILEILLLTSLGYGLLASARYDCRRIQVDGTVEEATIEIEAGTGSPSHPAIMSIVSSSVEFSGYEFRPWPIELHLESYCPKEWGFATFDNPFYADTIYDDWFRVSSSFDFVTRTEFIAPTRVEIAAGSMGIWYKVPNFVPEGRPPTSIHVTDWSKIKPFQESLEIDLRLPALVNGVPLQPQNGIYWKTLPERHAKLTAYPSNGGGSLVVLLAVGEIFNVLDSEVVYNPLYPLVEPFNEHLERPTELTIGQSEKSLVNFDMTGIKSLKLSGVDGNVNGGKAGIKAEDSLSIELRANGRLHIERRFGEDYNMTLSGDAVSFRLDGEDRLSLDDKQFGSWPDWLKVAIPSAFFFVFPYLLQSWRRRLGSLGARSTL